MADRIAQGGKRFIRTKTPLLSKRGRKLMIEPELREPSISRPCQLLGLSRLPHLTMLRVYDLIKIGGSSSSASATLMPVKRDPTTFHLSRSEGSSVLALKSCRLRVHFPRAPLTRPRRPFFPASKRLDEMMTTALQHGC